MNYKTIVSTLLIIILTFGVCSTAFATDEISDGYTPVYTAEDLNNIRNNLSGKYIIMNDIDLSSYENWVPVGTEEKPFNGVMNGNNHIVNKMNINDASNYIGFFGYADSAEIKNLKIENAKIEIETDENVVVGLISGQIENSVVSNCKVNGTMAIKTEGNAEAGGIVGIAWCNNEVADNCYIGECINYANISVVGKVRESTKTKGLHTGGIAGRSTDTAILKCGNEGNIKVSNYDTNSVFANVTTGGICGFTLGNIKDCYNVGSINAESIDYAASGGIAGYWESRKAISNLYNTGNICSVLTVDDGTLFDGALIGCEEGTVSPDDESGSNEAFLSNCYYINNGLSSIGFAGSCSSDNVKTLTKDEFKVQSSFVGFDFENVWEMNEEIGRPVLKQKTASEEKVLLVDAEIIKVPFNKRIVFAQFPKSPEGITIKLTYSDGTNVTEKVVTAENGYYVNGELLEEAGRTAEVIYGVTSAGYFMNEEKIYISYDYLSLPSVLDFFKTMLSRLINFVGF